MLHYKEKDLQGEALFYFLKKRYNHPFSSFLQVKRNISDLINIPVRHQQWEGWPVSASDDSVRDTLKSLHSGIF